mgnify:CR=1 FL=1
MCLAFQKSKNDESSFGMESGVVYVSVYLGINKQVCERECECVDVCRCV